MKKRGMKFVFLITVLFLIALAAIYFSIPRIYFSPDDGTTSTRSFVANSLVGNEINKPITVNLAIDYDPASATPFIDIIQAIPQGFNIIYEGISNPRPDLAAYFPANTTPIQLTKFSPTDENLSYVLIPNPAVLCPSALGTSIPINTLYLAPPEEPRPERGTASIFLAQKNVTRTLSKSETNVNREITVYLHVYPACEDSYTITENFPLGWTVIDEGGGSISGNTITWNMPSCSGRCESTVIAYKLRAPSIPTSITFSGIYKMPLADPNTMYLPFAYLQVKNVDCTAPEACAQSACQGEYCNAQQTATCSGGDCVPNSCGLQAGHYCGSSCQPGDVQTTNFACTSGVCCQHTPPQTCEQAGGYCVDNPGMLCPPGLNRQVNFDSTCNGGELPLEGNYPICCSANAIVECSTTPDCGTTDCSSLTTECRTYSDVSQTCSNGICVGICNGYSNDPLRTSCNSGAGACDGNGNCAVCGGDGQLCCAGSTINVQCPDVSVPASAYCEAGTNLCRPGPADCYTDFDCGTTSCLNPPTCKYYTSSSIQNICSAGSCIFGNCAPLLANSDAGTSCNSGTGTCDGNGNCVLLPTWTLTTGINPIIPGGSFSGGNVMGGTIDVPTQTYVSGTMVKITPTVENSNFEFSSWTLDDPSSETVNPADNSLTVNMSNNHNVKANFRVVSTKKIIEVRIRGSSAPNNVATFALNPAPTGVNVPGGDILAGIYLNSQSVQVSVSNVNPSFTFSGWYDGNTFVSSQTTYTIPSGIGNHNLLAQFDLSAPAP